MKRKHQRKKKTIFFHNDIHPMEGTRATPSRDLQSMRYRLGVNVAKKKVNLRHEQVKIVVIGKA